MDGMAGIWTRDTPWRQGHVLTSEAAKALGLSYPESPDSTCVVVISHDCDLANDAIQIEPDVEVIVGRSLLKGDGNYFWAKAPRTLHVDAHKNDAPAVIELVATAKRLIPKQELAAFAPDGAYSFPSKSLPALRSWLGVRYNRAAFPDLFVDRLSQSKVDKRLAKTIEPVGNLLSAVYFDVDGGREIDRSDGSPYELKIVLTYPPGDDPEQAAEEVEKLEIEIAHIFEKKLFDQTNGKWNGIALKGCMSISEDDLAVSKARLLTQWRLEYMTLKVDEGQPGALA
jgi:hypothetical protein